MHLVGPHFGDHHFAIKQTLVCHVLMSIDVKQVSGLACLACILVLVIHVILVTHIDNLIIFLVVPPRIILAQFSFAYDFFWLCVILGWPLVGYRLRESLLNVVTRLLQVRCVLYLLL